MVRLRHHHWAVTVFVVALVLALRANGSETSDTYRIAQSDNVVEEPDWEELDRTQQLAIFSLQSAIEERLSRLGEARVYQRHDPEAVVLMELALAYEELARLEHTWARHVFDSQVRNCLGNGYDDCLDTIQPGFHRSVGYERNAQAVYSTLLRTHPSHPLAELARNRLDSLVENGSMSFIRSDRSLL